jgi:23S rRNA-/tRNA-specific pseudouridylate synthase
MGQYTIKSINRGVILGLPDAGRKHQLRLHAAFALGAPILGDALYGAKILPSLWAHSSGRDKSHFLRQLKATLHLHCRTLEIKRPGKGAWTVTAPLPQHMATLFAGHG